LRRTELYQSKEPLIKFYSTSGISAGAKQAAEKSLKSVQSPEKHPAGPKGPLILRQFGTTEVVP
jgi:hypothetical protein